MRKCFLLLIILVSFVYLSQTALSLDYKCDSRPNSFFNICAECASACDYVYYANQKIQDYPIDCNNACPAGTVLVDCNYNYLAQWHANCKNLVCGDAGVPSGSTCIQQSSLDSSCVNVAPKTYGWTDNTAFLSCACYDTTSATINQYTKKVDGTVCTDKNGKTSSCKSGVCQVVQLPPTIACPDGTLENACCATPGTRCKNDGTGNLVCQTDATCPLCTDTDGGKVSGTKGTCKDVSGGVCDWRKGGCTDTCASNGAVNE